MIQYARRSDRAEYAQLLEAAHRVCADLGSGLDPRTSRPDAVATLSSHAASTTPRKLGRRYATGEKCGVAGVPETPAAWRWRSGWNSRPAAI